MTIFRLQPYRCSQGPKGTWGKKKKKKYREKKENKKKKGNQKGLFMELGCKEREPYPIGYLYPRDS